MLKARSGHEIANILVPQEPQLPQNLEHLGFHTISVIKVIRSALHTIGARSVQRHQKVSPRAAIVPENIVVRRCGTGNSYPIRRLRGR